MKSRLHLHIRSIILTGFTLLIFKLVVSGDLYNFISPKMLPYFYFTLIVLFILGYVQHTRKNQDEQEIHCDCNHEHSYSSSYVKSLVIYSLFIIPIFTGLFFSNHTLGSAMADKKGFKYESKADSSSSNEQNSDGNAESEDDYAIDESAVITPKELYPDLYQTLLSSETISLEPDQYIGTINLIEEEPHSFKGKEIMVKGFVYREPTFDANRIVIGRFGVSCCVADAGIYGIMAEGKDFSSYESDSWVEVTGTLNVAHFKGWDLPLIEVTSIKNIQEPKKAYVYENIDYSNVP
ncbi:TIGR03943 family putative permease subunit [Pontibacillus yanchengensis]|uniref:TIGR03943 family protein n=1 Tax=Pontibacillus yanchengensis Y32 TaxID=1385514 RepID=A0A0A2T855_9BACI|nr:TIGR03943 family protein [Pontibacillus yanchengensis]KGP71709.1 hypothetical protein N782_17000 [Pontibacillus yanchengensis Y32]